MQSLHVSVKLFEYIFLLHHNKYGCIINKKLFSNGKKKQIEFLIAKDFTQKGENYTILDPDQNNKQVLWKNASRWAKLKYWQDVMTLEEKHEMQNRRKRVVTDYTEVIDI